MSRKPNEFTELLYIWISDNDTGFIRNQGFNFSPRYRFMLHRSLDEQKYELTCIENKNYPNIWKTDTNTIVGLTAVVGQNGTGKSSLMKHLMDPTLSKKWILIYRINGVKTLFHNFSHKELEDKTGFLYFGNNEASEQCPSIQDLVQTQQTRIFISNAWNSMRSSIGINTDSLNHLIFSPDDNYIMRERFRMKIERNFPSCSIRGTSLRSKPNCVFSSSLIDYNEIVLLHYYDQVFTSGKNSDIISENSTIQFDFCKHLNRPSKYTDSVEQRNIRNAIYKHHQSPCYGAYLALCIELSSIMFEEFSLNKDVIEAAHELVSRYCADCKNDDWTAYYQNALSEIDQLQIILEKGYSIVHPNDQRSFVIQLSYQKKGQRQAYIEFCAYISELFKKKRSFVLRYIHIDTSPVSSGEQALHNIFSYLYLTPYIQEIFDIASHPALRSDILLLLDEVDLYMHPEWQRKFISMLTSRLEREYPDKHIQLVLTTHSPLVLSDIPSGNIIYLSNDKNRCTVVDGPNKTETFGANIFTLLKDSFYLDKSLGEFAFSRIEAIIKDLQMLKENPDNIELRNRCRKHKHLIEIIGEPIIKQKMQMLYTELFATDSNSTHRHQLAELEHIINTSDPQKREKYNSLLAKVLSEMKEI